MNMINNDEADKAMAASSSSQRGDENPGRCGLHLVGGPINGMVTTLYPEPRGWAPAKDNVPVSPVGPRPLSKPKAHMVPQLILFPPRKSFAVKDEIFSLFEGALDNLGSLRQQYGLAKSANEGVLVIEAYKALRDRAPYPPNHVVGHLSGSFAFIVFDKSTSTLFVASDQFGKVPLSWGITADGYVAFADDAELLKGACGKSLASFPQGCFFSTAVGELRSFENPKNKITAVPAPDEEIWGATFKVEGPAVLAATK
ncbi:Stem-specific protein TSJT1 [Vitis vinifera]|uniref:Stem-specific protein TSJT1 n=1 Tax=Vitis vinifera TaxID=29760 RepID=A0A438F659_VITVI|nr:Stem-specific protein TSJT1 [Vitis vinifera]